MEETEALMPSSRRLLVQVQAVVERAERLLLQSPEGMEVMEEPMVEEPAGLDSALERAGQSERQAQEDKVSSSSPTSPRLQWSLFFRRGMEQEIRRGMCRRTGTVQTTPLSAWERVVMDLKLVYLFPRAEQAVAEARMQKSPTFL